MTLYRLRSSMTLFPVWLLLSLVMISKLSSAAVLSVPSQTASVGQLLATAVTLIAKAPNSAASNSTLHGTQPWEYKSPPASN